MRLNVFILLLLFSGSYVNLHSQQKWKWEKINYAFPEEVNILSAVSSNNFWVKTKEGDVIHYLNNKTIKYKTIIPSGYTRILFAVISHNEFIAAAMDNQWRTHFYNFFDGKWRKDPFVFPLPMQALIKIDEGLTYAIGNFGSMLKYQNNSWIEIKTPLKSHINLLKFISPQKIFLLTNSEGVFLFDGNTFTRIQFEEKNKADIIDIKGFSNSIFALDSKRKIYSYSNGRFVLDNSLKNKSVFGYRVNFAYVDVAYTTDHHKYIEMKIPLTYRFTSYKSYHKDSLLFSEQDGYVYKAGLTENNYFTNLSKVLGIKSDDYTFNHIGGIYDFNNDGLPDIMAVNKGVDAFFTVFVNDRETPFRKVVFSPFEQEILLIPTAAFLDYNCDSFVDFAVVVSDTGGISLAVFENDKKGNFFKAKSIPLLFDDNNHIPFNIKPVDFDADGKMDLCVSYYYGPLDKTGYEIIVNNSFFNGLSKIDTSYKKITQSWNLQSLFADFNGDDQNDWFIANKWRKNKLLIQGKGSFTDESEKRISPLNVTETSGASAVDFDNDGDLDILTVSDHSFLMLFQNNGRGFFTDVTTQFGLNKTLPGDAILNYVSLTTGDFNNDGFTDIFVSDLNKKKSQNFLLMNIEGKYFIDKTIEMQITIPILHYSTAADIDNDGDIDIFTYGANEYALWVNNLNENNFIKIRPRGVISNTDGWGAKIWIYEHTHLDDPSFLRGYKQAGSETFGNVQNSEYIAHFGVDRNKLYDVKVKFYGGKEIVLTDLKPGRVYYVDELNDFFSLIYTFPHLTVRILQNREVQFYIVTTIFTFLILYFATKRGLRKYQWNIKLALGFVSASISLYWLLILLTNDSSSYFQKYFLPVLMASASIAIPNIVFLWITRNQNKMKSLKNLTDDLLTELMNFSHGAWALSNLNSLQMLYEHARTNLNNPHYIDTINERQTTFNEMVFPRLSTIADLSIATNISSEIVRQLKHSLKILFLTNQTEEAKKYPEFAQAINIIKESLSGIKKIVYQSFSSNPIEVIKITCNSLQKIFEENKVAISRSKYFEIEKAVLIKSYELADIIDNCLQNSVKSLSQNGNKEISLKIYCVAPKVCIDVADNGIGIIESDWEKIFESGYSKGSSSGFGLFSARQILKKYGGRIYVKTSNGTEGTIFTIELNEGIMP